ncbi:hypothetical protein ABZV60_04435 [Streptomyces sp. NPDC004787]|uniref:hypothetical protein n=1 Tax=Streptomyces sp. NPDC004787 TaxID=3154291 RepID=UPI0033A11B6E
MSARAARAAGERGSPRPVTAGGHPLLAEGVVPPLHVSADLPGGHERNAVLEARYAGHLHRGGH